MKRFAMAVGAIASFFLFTVAASYLSACARYVPSPTSELSGHASLKQMHREPVERVLYTLGSAGDHPSGGVAVLDGSLYGTTTAGGVGCEQAGPGCGVVFEVTPTGSGYNGSVIYRFTSGRNGRAPVGALLASNGKLYGATSSGGGASYYGLGTVYRITPGPTVAEKVLLAFNQTNGNRPGGGLISDPSGDLYGVASGTGAVKYDFGIVYELARSRTGYTERVLHDFQSASNSDGYEPQGALLRDSTGALYGTTYFGAGTGCPAKGGCGTVFKLTPSATSSTGYTYAIIHQFRGGKDGAGPTAGLVEDKAGSLFGTASYGGNPSCRTPGGVNVTGCGAVFKLTPTARGYRERIIYRFGFRDGADPGGLIIDGQTLYGTALFGGLQNPACFGGTCGLVFGIVHDHGKYAEKTVYEFQGGSDGEQPNGLVVGTGTTLYGTTLSGGGSGCYGYGCGTVFRLEPSR